MNLESVYNWNQRVCPSVCPSVCPFVRLCVLVSVCVQNVSFCESAGGGIKSHLATALVK